MRGFNLSQLHFGFQPEVIAHRGVRTLANMQDVAPENTLPAFLQAADLNAAIELDVIATQDGHLVVHHDDKTGRIFKRAEGNKPVQQLRWQDVSQLNFNQAGNEATVNKMLGQPYGYQTASQYRYIRVPELETVLESVWQRNPNTHFYLELKTYNRDVLTGRNNHLEQRVADLIRQKNLYDRVTVISFSPLSLKRIKEIDPQIKTGWDLNALRFLQKHEWALKLLVQCAKQIKVASIHPPYDSTTESFVRIAHQAGLKVAPYVDQETRLEEKEAFPRLTALGVDGIITNAVDQLKAFLGTL